MSSFIPALSSSAAVPQQTTQATNSAPPPPERSALRGTTPTLSPGISGDPQIIARHQEQRRLIVAEFLEQAGWARPEYLSFTLQQHIFIQLSHLSDRCLNGPPQRSLLQLIQYTFLGGGAIRPPLDAALSQLQTHFSSSPEVTQWLSRLNIFFTDEILFNKPLSFITGRESALPDANVFCDLATAYVNILRFCDPITDGMWALLRVQGDDWVTTYDDYIKSTKPRGSQKNVFRHWVSNIKLTQTYWKKSCLQLVRSFNENIRRMREGVSVGREETRLVNDLKDMRMVFESLFDKLNENFKTAKAQFEAISAKNQRPLTHDREWQTHMSQVSQSIEIWSSFLNNLLESAESDCLRFWFMSSLWSTRDARSLADSFDFIEQEHNVPMHDKGQPCPVASREMTSMQTSAAPVAPPPSVPSATIAPTRHGPSVAAIQALLSDPIGDLEPTRHLTRIAARHDELFMAHAHHSIASCDHIVHGKELQCRQNMRGLANHFFLSACGFELAEIALKEHHPEWLSAILFPETAAQYLIAELFGNTTALLRNEPSPEVHDLILKSKALHEWDSLSPMHQSHLKGISQALLWYRYAESYMYSKSGVKAALPAWVENVGLIEKQKRKMNPEEVCHHIDFLTDTFIDSYELLMHRLFEHDEASKEPLTGAMRRHCGRIREHLYSLTNTATPSCQNTMYQHEWDIAHRLLQECREILLVKNNLCQRPDVQQSLREVISQLVRLQHTIGLARTCPHQHLFAFLLRNLFNVQWLMEHLYRTELMSLGCSSPIWTHSFRQYEELLDDLQGGERDHIPPEHLEYNNGIWLHYEELCQHPTPSLGEYKQILENSHFEAEGQRGESPTFARAIDPRERFASHASRIFQFLERKVRPLLIRLRSAA